MLCYSNNAHAHAHICMHTTQGQEHHHNKEPKNHHSTAGENACYSTMYMSMLI